MKTFVPVACIVLLTLGVLFAQTTNRPYVRGLPDTSNTTNPPIADNISVPDARYPYPILDITGKLIWPTNFWERNGGVLADLGHFGVSSFNGRIGPVTLLPSDLAGLAVSGGGVTSFNNRSNAVSLQVSDVTTLGTLANDTTGNAASATRSQAATFRIDASAGGAAALELYKNGESHILLVNDHINLLTDLALVAPNFAITPSLVGYSPTITLDFAGNGHLWMALGGDVTFTSTNLTAGKGITVRIDAGGGNRTIHCPASWHYISGAPTISLPATKMGLLSVMPYDGTDANCVATWASE